MCPAKPRRSACPADRDCAFNGGPGMCPAKPRRRPAWPNISNRSSFNGGPGMCPAKPGRIVFILPPAARPSMEGRACARPNQSRGLPAPHLRDPPSMEGRACARPNPVGATLSGTATTNLQWRAGHVPGQTSRRSRSRRQPPRSFNGGPGMCPAKPQRPQRPRSPVADLQWRAGHVPGQTSVLATGTYECPGALQWRAGHVPGQTRGAGAA